MPNYRLVQEFERHKKPLIPEVGTRTFQTPPFLIAPEFTKCGLEISDVLPGLVAKFSFAQVRELAQDIVEECNSPGKPGYGGQWTIGQNNGWMIRIFGIAPVDPQTNVTSLPEVSGDMALITNTTKVSEPLNNNITAISEAVSIFAAGETS